MRIMYINSVYQYGSTGRLVKDLSQEAKSQGNTVLCVYGRHYQGEIDDTFYIGSKVETFVHVLMTRLFGRHGMHSKRATRKLIKKIDEFNASVIHLHNLHGYYLDVPLLINHLKNLDIKIILTLHDTWLMSGSGAYYNFNGCKLWDDGCVLNNVTIEYPQVWLFPNQKRNFNWKKDSFLGFKNLHIITVSDWLKEEVLSTFFKDYNVTRIYNGIDLKTFSPKKNTNLSDKIKLLGVANIWEKRKGLDDFVELSKMLPSEYSIQLIGLDKKQINLLPSNIQGIERTSSIEELVNHYQDADIYLNLSVEETMGLTTVEAMACGTPCVVYNKTAVPEIIDSKSGIITEANNLNLLVQNILNFKFEYYTIENIRNRAEYFSMDRMYSEYFNLYNK